MRRIILTTMLMSFLGSVSFAQSGSIKAVINDATDSKPVQGATVSLLLQLDSSVVKTALTDSLGQFLFDNLAADSFIVKISTIGYQDYFSFVTLKDTIKDLGYLP